MRRLLIFALVIPVLLAAPIFAAADPAADAAALAAERKEAEEKYRQLSRQVEHLVEAQAAQQKRLGGLAEELGRSREEASRATRNFVTREELKEFVEKLQDLDRKREADKKLFLESLDEIRKLIRSAPSPAAPPKEIKTPKATAPAEGPEQYFEYSVEKDNRLIDIVKAYNEKFREQGKPSITVDQVLKANPGLKPERLRVGQKIKIPGPTEK